VSPKLKYSYLLLFNPLIIGVSGLLACYFFIACCRVLSPGAQRRSYFFWGSIFVCAPILWQCAITSASDVLALAIMLASFQFSLQYSRRWFSILGVFLVGILVMLYHFGSKLWVLGHWSFTPFMPLCYWGFYVLLPLIFILTRKTDLYLPEKKILLGGLLAYILLLMGLPEQNIRYLLPIWGIVLLLLFPAFDRFVSYGFLYAKNATITVLMIGWLVQIVGIISIIYLSF
jgi:hypothetical protein